MYVGADSTLGSSYLKEDYWVFEVEILVKNGMALLRANSADMSGAAMLHEALNRLLRKRWAAEELHAKTPKPWYKPTRKRDYREQHHSDLENMATGALYHFGWGEAVRTAHEAARDGYFVGAVVNITVDVLGGVEQEDA
jgi:hypothetical protein